MSHKSEVYNLYLRNKTNKKSYPIIYSMANAIVLRIKKVRVYRPFNRYFVLYNRCINISVCAVES